MNTTQETAATAGQAKRILEEILSREATREQVQSIINSGILSCLTQANWGSFDQNLFCFNNDIPAFEISEKTEINVDYQKPLETYWDRFIKKTKNKAITWLNEITFPDLSKLGSVKGDYAIIKCRREMSNEWLDKFMLKGGFSHVNHVELLSFYDQGFDVWGECHKLWALKTKLSHKHEFDFFPLWNKNARSYSGAGLIQMFDPDHIQKEFHSYKDTCILVRCT